MVFLIDLPRLPVRPVRQTKDELTFFGRELLYYLEAMGLDNDIRNGVLNFDFSKTEGIAFVHTMYRLPFLIATLNTYSRTEVDLTSERTGDAQGTVDSATRFEHWVSAQIYRSSLTSW